VQDLVGLAAAAVADAPGVTATIAGRLERYAADRAEKLVVCSPGFEEHFVRLGVPASKVETILNWVDTTAIDAGPSPSNGRPTRFLYSGNLGYTQGFETLAAAAALAGESIELDIVGAGNALEQVEALGLPTRPPVPLSEFPALLSSADVHVVLQRAVAAGANLPSKIAPYLASGRPIVASIAPDTPAARLLDESGGALIVPPERPDLLAVAMARLRDDSLLRRRLGESGRAYAVAHLDRGVCLRELEAAFLG
jgi:colanic acid biosynthesis glycosyl transferase WcaI